MDIACRLCLYITKVDGKRIRGGWLVRRFRINVRRYRPRCASSGTLPGGRLLSLAVARFAVVQPKRARPLPCDA
jgi:hypothetical protein